ncbi:Phosphoglucomutase-3 [Chamberlinius hualienensis]
MMSIDDILANVKLLDEKHPKAGDAAFTQYGTAGFRELASRLDHVVFRVGLVAALRSKILNAHVGVMITASHNPEEDNGVKLVDKMGEMLEASWEVLATELVNSNDLVSALQKLIESTGVSSVLEIPSRVIVGRDTRVSSKPLSEALIDGVKVFNGEVDDFGTITTPQLHYLTRCKNSNLSYGEYSEDGYYKKLSEAFRKLRGNENSHKRYVPKLRFDGSNGVGAQAVRKLNTYLGSSISIEVFNDGLNGKLNYMCGADYVKVNQRPPEGILLDAGVRCVSLDGDADRVIYFYITKMGEPKILDGDKIATLIAGFVKKLVEEVGLDVHLGLVQTAYANGSSTKYVLEKLKVPVAITATGVKYLHHEAEKFHIGIYFEANGHGTVMFNDETKEKIRSCLSDETKNQTQKDAAQLLINFIDLVNETVGDAISDMLIVETILHYWGWGIDDWDNAYNDLPNRLRKVEIPDRNGIKTDKTEQKVLQPAELQTAIDELVSKYRDGRSFVRPSGTENVVRVYAEAATQNDADQLAEEVCLKVKEITENISQ